MFQAEFLMIEDNPADIRLTEEYFKENKISNHLNVVKNEVQALQFLRRQNEYAQAITPDLIFISIALLWADGRLLHEMKSDATLENIPIVVLMATLDEQATLQDDASISLCLTKPVNFDCLVQVVKRINQLGFLIARPAN